VSGGERLGPAGTFISPTVIAGVKQDMEIVREEVFGPVLAVQKFDDFEEVVAAANDSVYGLAASVWTESLSNAHRMSSRIKAGTVWINCHLMAATAGARRSTITLRPRPSALLFRNGAGCRNARVAYLEQGGRQDRRGDPVVGKGPRGIRPRYPISGHRRTARRRTGGQATMNGTMKPFGETLGN